MLSLLAERLCIKSQGSVPGFGCFDIFVDKGLVSIYFENMIRTVVWGRYEHNCGGELEPDLFPGSRFFTVGGFNLKPAFGKLQQ